MPWFYAFTTCGWHQFKPPNFGPQGFRKWKTLANNPQWGHYQGAFLFFLHPILLEDLSPTIIPKTANMRGQGQLKHVEVIYVQWEHQDTTEFFNQVTTMMREAWTTTISQFQDAHTLSHRTSWIVFDITNTPETHLGCTYKQKQTFVE